MAGNVKTPRNVKLSFYQALEDLFTNASTFGEAFNVYYEEDLLDGTVPVIPYVYIFDAGVEFPADHLPVVACWFGFEYRGFELGGVPLWHGILDVDVYGKNRGEREDIAAAIAEGIYNKFTVNDYSGGSAVPWGTASIHEDADQAYWRLTFESVGDPLTVEGTLANWARCVTQFWAEPT